MADSNPIQEPDTNEMEPENNQTDKANVEAEGNYPSEYSNELNNLGNENYPNDVPDDNSANIRMDNKDDVSDDNSAIRMDNNDDISDYSLLMEITSELDQPTPANENKTALDQFNINEKEIDQPTEQPTDTSINQNEPINASVTNSTGVNMTEPDLLRYPHAIMDEPRNFTEERNYEETETETEEASQPVVYTKTEFVRQVTSNGLDVDSHETANEPELAKKVIWPANLYNNEIEDEDDDDDDDEIEEVNMIKIQNTRLRRRPIRQQQELLSPSNNISNINNINDISDISDIANISNIADIINTANTTSSNVHPNDPNAKKYSLSHIAKIFTVLSLIILIFYSQLGRQPSFLRNFADTTNIIFKGINSVELPDANTMSNHTITLRRASNTFDRSPVFKSYGGQISTGLRDLGDTIREAGQLLRNMYSKGLSLHTSFGIEIEAMVQMVDRKDLHHLQGDDAEYFKERLNRLATKIKDFRESVDKVHSYIINAEKIKLDNEGSISDGFREAEKYSDNEKYSGIISKAKNDLEPLEGIFQHLRSTADQLDRLRIMLKDYEDRLMGISDELGGEEAVKVTKSDLKYLQHVIHHSKASLDEFNKRAQASD